MSEKEKRNYLYGSTFAGSNFVICERTAQKFAKKFKYISEGVTGVHFRTSGLCIQILHYKYKYKYCIRILIQIMHLKHRSKVGLITVTV